MKKMVIIVIVFILVLFFSKFFIVLNDLEYKNKLVDNVINNTDIDNLEYVNMYNKYYVIMDKEYIYIYDNDFVKIFKESREKLYTNDMEYDLIYKDNVIMYLDDYMDDDKLIFKYYDAFTYELIDEIVVWR